jgi:hypothetical protein
MILRARTQSAAFYSGYSGQGPLVLNHIEPRYKDKVGSVPRRGQLAFARQGAKERESSDDGCAGQMTARGNASPAKAGSPSLTVVRALASLPFLPKETAMD